MAEHLVLEPVVLRNASLENIEKDMTLNEYLREALENHYAIGHFNFATADVLRAIVEGAKEAEAPAVMVGTSEGEADFLGMLEAVALVGAMRKELDFPIFLNADHFKSVEKCKEALNAGYDTVLFDGSKLSYEDNLAAVQRVKHHAQEKPVEGEIGYLRGSSEVQGKVEISAADYTKPEQAKSFVDETQVDRLAIVFGNIHGIVTEQEEKLDIEHLKKVVALLPRVPIVLHGASGLPDDQVRSAIRAGIANVHFNTELRVVYAEGIEKAIHAEKPASPASPGLQRGEPSGGLETTPYKYLGPAAEEVKKLVAQKIKLFMSR